MPFGVVNGVGREMGVLDGGSTSPMERAGLGNTHTEERKRERYIRPLYVKTWCYVLC